MSPSTPKNKSSLLTKTRSILVKLYKDERGAEGLEKLLIIAAVVLPLLGVLIFFKSELGEWVDGQWQDVSTSGRDNTALPGGSGTP